MTAPLIQIKNLNVTFRAGDQAISAVRNISLDITPGQNIALVGESGSGKTVTALTLLGLHDYSATTVTGEIIFAQQNLIGCAEPVIRNIRGRHISMIF